MPSAKVNILHSSKSSDWFTPLATIEIVRRVLGEIDLDPASCEEANKYVQAKRYYSHQGLDLVWEGRVFCNPPYGSSPDATGKRRSNQALWTRKLLHEFDAGNTDEAILLVNAAPDRRWFHPLWERGWVALGYRREKFRSPSATTQKRSPTHANALVYLGPRGEVFAKEVSSWGRVVPPL